MMETNGDSILIGIMLSMFHYLQDLLSGGDFYVLNCSQYSIPDLIIIIFIIRAAPDRSVLATCVCVAL